MNTATHTPSHSDTVCIDLSDSAVNLPTSSREILSQKLQHVQTALIGFKDKGSSNRRTRGTDGELYSILEEQLSDPKALARKLIDRYSASDIDLKIMLHKSTLVEPVLTLMSEIAQNPDTFFRTELLIMPQIFSDQRIYIWIAEAPFARLPRIKIMGKEESK